MFDANAFMNQQVNGPLSTTLPAVPEGEYTAKVSDGDNYIEFREIDTKNGPRAICRVLYEVLDESLRSKLNRPTITVRQDIWLDTTPSGGLDTSEGQNTRLGQLRAALGQNSDAPWGFHLLKGAGPLSIRVSQRSDKNDPEVKYSEVVRTARIS